MKLFAVDWATVLHDMRRWTAMPLPARRVLLAELKPGGYVPVQRFGASLDEIVASGIGMLHGDRTRMSVAEEHRDLLKVLRAMHRHPVFDDQAPPALVMYLEEHFTQYEIESIGAGTGPNAYDRTTRQGLAARAAFAGWPGDLLAARGDAALAAWANARGWPADETSIWHVKGLQRLAMQLARSPEGVALRDIMPGVKEADVPLLGDALYTGLATLAVFAGMRTADLEPMIGLWPPAARELARPPAKRPSVVVPVERFELAVTMEDMTAVLATVLAAPIRLRADDMAVFARTRAVIEARLVELPPWAEHLYADQMLTRVDVASRELERLGLVRVMHLRDNPHLQATQNASAWLSLTPRDRLASLIDPMRSSKEANPRGSYDDARALRFFPFALPYFHAPESLNVREAVTSAFLGAGNGFVALEPFLRYAVVEGNPFLALLASADRSMDGMMLSTYGTDPRESYRTLWRNALVMFLSSRLLGLGGASAGRLPDGTLCFALTDIGRYLLGAAGSFTYGGGATADVVIQPNFDVVFLGAAPSTEALLSRFAERVGVAPGLTFRITRASVLAAAESGATADDVLGALREASSKPLPKNVEREIAGWMATVRRATLRLLLVIECADVETADRAGALLGAKVRRLTPTMIELPGLAPSARAAILKRLRAGGVFLDGATTQAEPRAKKGKRRPRRPWEDESLPPDDGDDMDLE